MGLVLKTLRRGGRMVAMVVEILDRGHLSMVHGAGGRREYC